MENMENNELEKELEEERVQEENNYLDQALRPSI